MREARGFTDRVPPHPLANGRPVAVVGVPELTPEFASRENGLTEHAFAAAAHGDGGGLTKWLVGRRPAVSPAMSSRSVVDVEGRSHGPHAEPSLFKRELSYSRPGMDRSPQRVAVVSVQEPQFHLQ